MAGGLRSEFHRVYAADTAGAKFLCELHDKRCRLFFDVDLIARCALTGDWLLWLCVRLQDVLRDGGFAQPADCRLVATAAEPGTCDTTGLVKSGVHLHAPDVVVTTACALEIRAALVTMLLSELGELNHEGERLLE